MDYKHKRYSGILLHPSSLPNRFGIGDFGQSAYEFINFLASSKQRLWQILPLGPTSYGDSPYQCLSAFAGNPYFIDLDRLKAEGYLSEEDLSDVPDFPKDKVDYGWIFQWKPQKLRKAYQNFLRGVGDEEGYLYEQFCNRQHYWLEDYAIYSAIKESYGGRPWNQWEEGLRKRDPKILEEWCNENEDDIRYHRFVQFQVDKHWNSVKSYAHEKGVQIVGDIPIFVAYDSADVWANQHLFELDEEGAPTVVAGTPPDYFSETGQLWGNPLYNWAKNAEDGYQWWKQRFQRELEKTDIIRIDHFRGFAEYWEVPAQDETAANGRWIEGPRHHFFRTLREQMGELPLIAEDLGFITPMVGELRTTHQFPGMKILQFAFFEGNDNPFLPHAYEKDFVVYTGTHDNNTTRGCYKLDLSEEDRKRIERYVGKPITEENVTAEMTRLAWASTAAFAIIPLQDLLNLDEKGRLNTPGKAAGNWCWRFNMNDLNDDRRDWLIELTETYQRFG